ncbi:MAG: sensor histidine kinase [Arenimonas sp.]|uniref:sensor histidine kinase n=1 Tax=Arenimonas sp. TaxID=1872635 RepID=UPI0025B99097|nr:sensor histidine kinase [Arenimonas sp.]MBW8368868.1 sensor histidine kinase [Arenimonas sp.]
MGENTRHEYDDMMGPPWMGLVYLVFLFLPLMFWSGSPVRPWAVSAVAALVFLPMYFAFFRWRGLRQRALIPAVAALGLAVITVNPGGNTFVIYAFAMAGTVLPLRHALLAAGAMLVLTAALFFSTLPLPFAVGYVAMVTVIGGLVLGGVVLARARARRNAELRLTQDEVGRLAALAERERIGRDLHDLLGHTLSLVAIKSELAGRLVDADPQAAKRQIGEVENVARQALAQVREAVVGIRATGLQAELAATRLALLSAEVHLDQRRAPVALPPALESVLAMTLREATTNVLRHAQASRVDVELLHDAGELRLVISDDGRGGALQPGNGLAGMRERIAGVGGLLDIDSPAGGGTRLQVTLPRRAIEEAAP